MSSSGAERSVILCTGGFDHTIRFWEAPTGLCHRSLQYNDSQVNRLEITPDKQYLVACGNPHIRLFEVLTSNPNPITSFDGHTNNVTAIGFQKDRKWMYSGSEDGSIKIWDIRSSGYQRDYNSPSKAPINSVVLHPNQGELIAGDEDGNIKIWDLTANQVVAELTPDGKTPIRSIAMASDASILLAANNKGAVYCWKVLKNGSYEMVQKLDAHSTYITKILLAPDVRLLATCSSDKTIKLWNVPLVSQLASNTTPSSSSSGSSSSSNTSSSSANSSSSGSSPSNSSSDSLPDSSKSFTLERTLSGHGAWVWDCSFSADSAYLVSASSDKTAKLWDVKTGEVILEYKGHHKAITAVALNDSS